MMPRIRNRQQLARFFADIDTNLVSIARKSAEYITADCIDSSPVLYGNFVASWNPSIGGPVPRNVDVKNGEQYRPNYSAVINGIDLGDVYSLCNGQPYAELIEFSNHSAKGNHVLTSAVSKWQEHVDRAVRDSKRGL